MIAAKRLQSESPRPAGVAPLDAAAIAAAATRLGVALTDSQSDLLAQYAALLLRWNHVHNLTAIDSPAQLLTHHMLDSLAILPEIQRRIMRRSMRLLDVGAGGGLPGIPLAIAAPELQVTLIDKVQKKVAFLTQVKLELGLHNIAPLHGRVETLQPPPFEVIVARAFASLEDFVGLTRHLLAPHGWWFAMKGTVPGAELVALKLAAPDVRLVDIVPLQVPGLQAERHLIVMQSSEK